MSKTVEIYYSFQSPHSYVALDPLFELQEEFEPNGVDFLWQPFSAKASGQVVPANAILPEKLSYLIEDTLRFSEKYKVPLVYPDEWPAKEYDPTRVTRGAVIALDLGVHREFVLKVFHKCWGLGENPNTDEFMAELCDDLDIDLGEFLTKISSNDARERVKGVYKRGKKFGVFDTPTIVVEGERFYGIDKIQSVFEFLREKKW